MPTSDNNTRTPKTTTKRTAATGENASRKRTTKKTAEATSVAAPPKALVASPVATAPKSAERAPVPATMAKSPTAPVPASVAASANGAGAVRPMSVATSARPDPVIAKVVDADERRRMIAEAAYHKFLQRGPGNGTPAQDWQEAESEIDALLAEQQIVRTQ